ncbi:2OG-Fe(II) oxygenase [Aestuariibacter sp. AA17]|uniref:2OG-Fe(II) oxygenase n=1 Tax=Fluctibacter corallii TaxID=2984329 RepID=A0ABT3ACC0_9ALTE|nr:2OG-Fe(II) oxygenase [Aestuariibacter sp. AA17]MCV2886265.1 2OG-Fe(II) oxygenase [Aestuariibacter sp. AA17]
MSDFVEVIDDVLSPELCQEFINVFNKSDHLAPGMTGGGVDTDKKRSTDVSISRHPEFSQLFQKVLPHVTENVMKYFEKYHFALIGPIGLTVQHPETGQPVKLTHENFEEVGKPRLNALVQLLFRIGEINAQKYEVGKGGYPYWHSEVYPQSGPADALHRIFLFMFYLNDVDEGGETEFYYQNKKVEPKAGRMVIAPAYFTHTHRGNIPVSNDKYILTSWILFNPAEKIYTPPAG